MLFSGTTKSQNSILLIYDDMPPIENTPHFFKLITKSASCSPMEMKGLGKAESSRLTTDESAALKCAEYVLDVVTVRRFTRLQVKGRVFDSLSWHESQRRHNSTIKFTIDSCEQIGHIKTFVKLPTAMELYISSLLFKYYNAQVFLRPLLVDYTWQSTHQLSLL